MAELEKNRRSGAPDRWLVRTADNRILGPFPKDRIRQLIETGSLGLQDEVCQANHYWFFLHETEEVRKQLGIILTQPADDEETLTSPEMAGDRTDPAIGAPAFAEPVDAPEDTAILTIPRPSARPAGATASVAPPPLNHGSSKALSASGIAKPSNSGKVERPLVWRGFAFFLLAGVFFLIYLVLETLGKAN